MDGLITAFVGIVGGTLFILGGAGVFIKLTSHGRYNLTESPCQTEERLYEDVKSGKTSWADYYSGLEKANRF